MSDQSDKCYNEECHYLDKTYEYSCSKGEKAAFDACDFKILKPK
jgi:hypothetical protein